MPQAKPATPDTGDLTTNPPIERTGWGGDGAPDNGSLRSFLTGAITQHYTKTLARAPGDFRPPTAQELDLTLAFQQTLGRTNELDLTQVNLFAKAEIAAAIAAPASSRGGKISNAISRVENARDQIGANVTFTLGAGNLFF